MLQSWSKFMWTQRVCWSLSSQVLLTSKKKRHTPPLCTVYDIYLTMICYSCYFGCTHLLVLPSLRKLTSTLFLSAVSESKHCTTIVIGEMKCSATTFTQFSCFLAAMVYYLTLSHPEALPWRIKSYHVRQSKLTKGTVLAGLGEKGLRNRDGQVGPVNPFPPRGSPLTSNIVWC